MSEVTALSLLGRLQAASDQFAWDQFLTAYRPWLLGDLRRRGVAADLADDVVQEVLTKVLQEIKRFEHNGRRGAFRNWLRAILNHRLRTELRRRRREPRCLGEALDQYPAGEGSVLSRRVRAEHDAVAVVGLLQRVAHKFQPRTLRAFRRLVLDEQPAEQVARELRMSIGSVRVAQHRVLAALRTLGPERYDDEQAGRTPLDCETADQPRGAGDATSPARPVPGPP